MPSARRPSGAKNITTAVPSESVAAYDRRAFPPGRFYCRRNVYAPHLPRRAALALEPAHNPWRSVRSLYPVAIRRAAVSLTRDPQSLGLLYLDSRELPQYLTREQIPALVGSCKSERDRMFVRVGFETGGRVSELLEIRKSDIDLSNRQIRLRTLKRKLGDRRRKHHEFFRWIPVSTALCADLANFMLQVAMHGPSKGDAARHGDRLAALDRLLSAIALPAKVTLDQAATVRELALPVLEEFHGRDFKKLHRELVRVRAGHRVTRVLRQARALELEQGRLVENMRLFPFSRQNADKIVRSAAKRAGLIARGGRDVSTHILRHSFAMNCLTQGVPITVLKDLLGHASITSTMVYLKTHPVEAKAFLEKVKF